MMGIIVDDQRAFDLTDPSEAALDPAEVGEAAADRLVVHAEFEPHPDRRQRVASVVRARHAQRQLAERLGLKEQQIQRYEATNYASASMERVSQVIEALGIEVREQVAVPARAAS